MFHPLIMENRGKKQYYDTYWFSFLTFRMATLSVMLLVRSTSTLSISPSSWSLTSRALFIDLQEKMWNFCPSHRGHTCSVLNSCSILQDNSNVSFIERFHDEHPIKDTDTCSVLNSTSALHYRTIPMCPLWRDSMNHEHPIKDTLHTKDTCFIVPLLCIHSPPYKGHQITYLCWMKLSKHHWIEKSVSTHWKKNK